LSYISLILTLFQIHLLPIVGSMVLTVQRIYCIV